MRSDFDCFYTLLSEFVGGDLDVPPVILEAISEFGVYTFEVEGIGLVIFSDSKDDRFVKIVTELRPVKDLEHREDIYANILRLNYGLNSMFGALTPDGSLALTANFYYTGKSAEDLETFMLKFFDAYSLYKNYANKLCDDSGNAREKRPTALSDAESSRTINMKLIV